MEQLPEPTPLFQLSDMPRFTHRAEPEYPATMRAQGIEGRVRLEVLIDNKGNIRKVTVLESAGEQFDQAAIQALENSRFTPGQMDGKPVAALLRIPVSFSLR